MGHWSAAKALQEQLGEDGHQVETVDIFSYAMPELAPTMYRGFSMLVTYGGLLYSLCYNLGYRLTANGDGRNGLAGLLMAPLSKLLDSRRPELVICTDWTCAATMSRYKEEWDSATPLVPVSLMCPVTAAGSIQGRIAIWWRRSRSGRG